MAKSWKKLVNSADSDANRGTGGNSLNDVQLTLDEIASQNQELNNLLQERQSLENEMGQLVQSSNPAAEDPRFAGSIESFREKREKEKNRIAQKKKLEERISRKSKELEKWEQNQQRLKQKLALQKKLLQKKETDQDPSTSQKALKSAQKSSKKNRFETDRLRKQKDVIEKKKEVFTERIRKAEKVPGQLKEQKKPLDYFGQKDLVKFRKKTDPEKKPDAIPVQIPKIKDNWDEKRESVKEKLKEKIALRKLSDKLEEAKRFTQLSEQGKKQFSEIKEMAKNLEKTVSLDDRQSKASENASAKKAEQKEEEERREKQKEGLLSRKKAERKEEERSNRMKERKKEKYD